MTLDEVSALKMPVPELVIQTETLSYGDGWNAAIDAVLGRMRSAEMSDDARDAMSLPPRDRGRRIGVQVGRWFVGVTR
jgi:hypothetical protein